MTSKQQIMTQINILNVKQKWHMQLKYGKERKQN